jgi:DNA-binding MarR family transcriptional regulator
MVASRTSDRVFGESLIVERFDLPKRSVTARKGRARRLVDRNQYRDVAHTLVRTANAFRRLRTQRMKEEFNITGVQAEILVLLTEEPAMLSNDLAAVVGVNTSTICHAIDAMERKNLVTRKRSMEDRRVVHVALTVRAKRIALRTIEVTGHTLDALTAGISKSDLKAMQRGLTQMNYNCKEHADATKQDGDSRFSFKN